MWGKRRGAEVDQPDSAWLLSGKLTPVAAAAGQGELRKRKEKWLWTKQARRDVPFHDLGPLAAETRC